MNNTTVDSLKALYIKLGGNADDIEELSTIPEMIDALTEIMDAEGGGGSNITVNGERMVVN